MMRTLLLRVAVIGLLAAPCGASVIYVDDDAPLGGNGLTWDTAFSYLQDALAVAQTADDIRVAQGTYKPDQDEEGNVTAGDREATFQLANGVAIYGGYAGLGTADPNERDIALYETVLSGDLAGNDEPDFANRGENSYHVVTCTDAVAVATLSGFLVTAGYANGPAPYERAGGLYNWGNPTVVQCEFSNNFAVAAGGGVRNSLNCSPQFTECLFSDNSVEGSGGGVANYADCTPTFLRCTFINNTAQKGGGMLDSTSVLAITDCVFSGNSASQEGGGLFSWQNIATLTDTRFVSNAALWGGGLYAFDSTPSLSNCVFDGNAAENSGGGVCNNVSNSTLIDCTITDNAAAVYGGGMMNQYSDPEDGRLYIRWEYGFARWSHEKRPRHRRPLLIARSWTTTPRKTASPFTTLIAAR